MAEGFELYHIPQQSRREKLRVFTSSLYDQSADHSISNNATNFFALSLSQNTHNATPHVDMQSFDCGGYASIFKGSKFLKPAQQLLDEICDVGFGIYNADKFPAVNGGLMTDSLALESLRTNVDDCSCGGVHNRKRSTLISLLDEVYKRYKHYYQQIQTVITSFETVAGLSNAAPFANLDIKTMSKHFHCLKNAITEQLQFTLKPHKHHISYEKNEFMFSGSFEKGLYGQMGFANHEPVWRPQRGLPKRAVTILRSWLFDHFLHPYPTDTDKQFLAKQTGLSRNQVSNWFINARVRVWKPMVEEVHTLETRKSHRMQSHIQQQETCPVSNSSSSQPMNQEPPSKRTRIDFPSENNFNNQHIMEGSKEHMNFYDNFSIQTGNKRGLPLTLGLHQNNNIITLSEPFSLNADGGSRRFVVGGFDARNQQVGREIIGDRFLHDFGG